MIFDYEQRRTQIKMEKIKRRAEEQMKFLIKSDNEAGNILNADDE